MDIKKVEEQLKKIPEEIKKAFFSDEVARKIYDIGQRNGLHIDQSDILVAETGYTMIGLKPTSEYVDNISKGIGIDKTLASKIATDINTEILMPIKSYIRSIESDEDKNKSIEQSSTMESVSTTPAPAVRTPYTNTTTSPYVDRNVQSADEERRKQVSELERLGDMKIEKSRFANFLNGNKDESDSGNDAKEVGDNKYISSATPTFISSMNGVKLDLGTVGHEVEETVEEKPIEVEDKETLLAGIEKPETINNNPAHVSSMLSGEDDLLATVKPENNPNSPFANPQPPAPSPQPPVSSPQSPVVDPIVEHLLQNRTGSVATKVTNAKQYTTDPYHEVVE